MGGHGHAARIFARRVCYGSSAAATRREPAHIRMGRLSAPGR
ncbi:hypothetical protein C731_2450 [Mycolicibacterium hassiacum DSM 44199]|uniref:Uncharacterized protein n=1 Tax=Mycolicibacterium hassiacum (strain DSM 44199 / CIP 105218 / JCM 12690 / 3849) TaxID=1122247 RepID=K5BJR3_MYCHD|nr:hypothetical protein C731_2450 [Mycolicibacterium hassiacum DSM 44199]